MNDGSDTRSHPTVKELQQELQSIQDEIKGRTPKPPTDEDMERFSEAFKKWSKEPSADVPFEDVYKHILGGNPAEPLQEQIIALLEAGPLLWNAWRKDYPHSSPSLDGAVFRNKVDLSLFELQRVTFVGTRFMAEARFDGLHLIRPDFEGAVFDDGSSFKFAVITSGNFRGVAFDGPVAFDGAVLIATSFDGATFGYRCGEGELDNRFNREISFRGALLVPELVKPEPGAETSFRGVQFGAAVRGWHAHSRAAVAVYFDGAAFGQGLRFDGAQFWSTVSFAAWTPGRAEAQWNQLAQRVADSWKWKGPLGLDPRSASVIEGKWAERAVKLRKDMTLLGGSGSDVFRSVSFDGAIFHSIADFEARGFKGSTTFGKLKVDGGQRFTVERWARSGEAGTTMIESRELELQNGQPVQFMRPPRMHDCALHPDTHLLDAQYLDTTSPGAAAAYRALKLAMNKQLAAREEQMFFRLEMKAEQAQATGFRRFLINRYEALSDFGESAWKPLRKLFWLMAVNIAVTAAFQSFSFCHSGITTCAFRWEQLIALLGYGTAHTFPIPGVDKMLDALSEKLFDDPGLGWNSVFALWSTGVKVYGAILLFLMGLGVRNQLKYK